jgi:deazaflavin-dependent oxidoreductase (nitroreductase family)
MSAARVGWVLRKIFRAPVWLYDHGLGRLLGRRFLCLTHIGRRSGRTYRTVLDVIGHDPAVGDYLVIAGLGPGADWYRNIQAKPAVEVIVGTYRFTPEQRVLTEADAVRAIAEYEPLCPYIGAAVELHDPQHPASECARGYKKAIAARLAETAREAGATNPSNSANSWRCSSMAPPPAPASSTANASPPPPPSPPSSSTTPSPRHLLGSPAMTSEPPGLLRFRREANDGPITPRRPEDGTEFGEAGLVAAGTRGSTVMRVPAGIRMQRLSTGQGLATRHPPPHQSHGPSPSIPLCRAKADPLHVVA